MAWSKPPALSRSPTGGGDVGGRDAGLGERAAGRRELRRPNRFRVVLHPAGLGVDLRELFLGGADWPAPGVKDNCPRGCGALIEGEDVIGHAAIPCPVLAGTAQADARAPGGGLRRFEMLRRTGTRPGRGLRVVVAE